MRRVKRRTACLVIFIQHPYVHDLLIDEPPTECALPLSYAGMCEYKRLDDATATAVASMVHTSSCLTPKGALLARRRSAV